MPTAAVAEVLRSRGHRTTLISIADGEPVARRYGFDFELVGAKTHPLGYYQTMDRTYSSMNVMRGFGVLRRDAVNTLRMFCREAVPKIRSLGADVIVCDQTEKAGYLIARRLELPVVNIVAGLPLNSELGVPPITMGWAYGTAPRHRLRNWAGNIVMDAFQKPTTNAAWEIANDWGLRMPSMCNDFMSGYAQISQLIPSLDMPRMALTKCFHYCGPFRSPAAPHSSPLAQDKNLAFASLGSIQGGRLKLFEAIGRATKASDLRLVLSHGGRLARDSVERLSRMAEVHAFVDQSNMMRQIGIAILHGGLNTVLDAAAAGVPSVIIPILFDQRGVAARVARSGAGRVCPLWLAPTGRLKSDVQAVRHDPSYAFAAARLKDEIAEAGGVLRAADIIEKVLRTGRPVLSDARA